MIFKHSKEKGGADKASLITHDAPLFIEGGAAYPFSAALAKKLTFKERGTDKNTPPDEMYYTAYRKKDGLLYVPPGCVPPCADDRRSNGAPVNVTSLYTPKNEEQARVVDESTTLLLAGQNHIVEAPTGFGKTYVGSAIAANCNRTTLVVVNKEYIIKQWREAICAVWGLKPGDIGHIQGDILKLDGRPIAIAMLQSLCKPGRYPAWVYSYFGTAIYDEVHNLGADLFTQVMWNMGNRLSIGLSARPERKDRKERLFKMFIGPTLVRSEEMPMQFKVLVVKTPYKLPKGVRKDPKTGEKKMVKLEPRQGRTVTLAKSMEACIPRTMIGLNMVQLAFEKGRRIVCFFETLDYLHSVREMAVKRFGLDNVGFLVGGMKEADEEHNTAKAILFTTYKMTSEAVNLPWLDTAVFFTPRSDVLQPVGRILRPHEGKKDPTVIDLLDPDSAVLSSFYTSRLKYYKSKGAPVKLITLE